MLKCNNCLTHFIQFEKKVNLENFYKEEYWEDFRREDREKSKPEIKNRVIQTINQILLNLVKMTGVQQSRSFSQYTFFKSYLQGNNLFEIGAGEGIGLKFFEKKEFMVSGLEPSIENVKIINKKLKNGKCESGFVEEDMPIKKFDVIIMSHILEHVKNPERVLSDLKNNLSEKGILFIEVPNCETIKELDNSISTQPHIYHFTKRGLEKLVEKMEYEILRIGIFHSNLNSFLDYVKYGVYWIVKKDFFMSSTVQDGSVIRIVLKNKNKIM